MTESPTLRTVLCAVDLSAHAQAALYTAADFSQTYQSVVAQIQDDVQKMQAFLK